MDYIERINRAIEFIEHHLTDTFTPSEAAHVACLSYYHFHRVFKTLTGMTLGEYTKNRRLSEAAKCILDGVSITDATFAYQFNNQQDFTRSFKKRFGVPPGQYKNFSIKTAIMERCVFTDDLVRCFNTLTNQTPEIRYFEPAPYIGLTRSGENIHEENLKLNYLLVERMDEIPFRLDKECTVFNRYKLENSINIYTYMVGFRVGEIGNIPTGMSSLVFGGNDFAIFKYRGTIKGLLGHIYSYIFGVWPYTSQYEIIPEVFNSTRFHNNICVPENEEMEIIIPVRRKHGL
jgi:AraC family transcriptional regulator